MLRSSIFHYGTTPPSAANSRRRFHFFSVSVLVATTKKESTTEVTNYFPAVRSRDFAGANNTGTLTKRDNKWQAVAWQATKIPADQEPKK